MYHLHSKKNKTHQNVISSFIGIDVSVASVTFKLLENKNYISRQIESDNRKKIVKMLIKGKNLFEDISPLIKKEEQLIFEKLKNETFNFTNSLKLLLGKKIRIQAKQ
jgi:DNA-binding MarR family transcriptional regulator